MSIQEIKENLKISLLRLIHANKYVDEKDAFSNHISEVTAKRIANEITKALKDSIESDINTPKELKELILKNLFERI